MEIIKSIHFLAASEGFLSFFSCAAFSFYLSLSYLVNGFFSAYFFTAGGGLIGSALAFASFGGSFGAGLASATGTFGATCPGVTANFGSSCFIAWSTAAAGEPAALREDVAVAISFFCISATFSVTIFSISILSLASFACRSASSF